MPNRISSQNKVYCISRKYFRQLNVVSLPDFNWIKSTHFISFSFTDRQSTLWDANVCAKKTLCLQWLSDSENLRVSVSACVTPWWGEYVPSSGQLPLKLKSVKGRHKVGESHLSFTSSCPLLLTCVSCNLAAEKGPHPTFLVPICPCFPL